MSDIKSAAREAAQAETKKRWPEPVPDRYDPCPYDEQKYERMIYEEGAEFIAGQIPGRDDLAGVVERNAVIPTSDAEAVADAVLLLIAERMRGDGEG